MATEIETRHKAKVLTQNQSILILQIPTPSIRCSSIVIRNVVIKTSSEIFEQYRVDVRVSAHTLFFHWLWMATLRYWNAGQVE